MTTTNDTKITTNVLSSSLPNLSEPLPISVGKYFYDQIEHLLQADQERVAVVSTQNMFLILNLKNII